MGRYILRRIIISIPVLFGISVAVFLLIHSAPGDPVTAMIDPQQVIELGPGWVEERRRALGLEQPLPVRYGIWIREASQGNLGYSYVDRRPVAQKIRERIWPTLKLMLAAEAIALLVAIPVGVASALKQYSPTDYAATVFAFAFLSIPNFFLGLSAIYIFGVQLGWFPTAGMFTVGGESSIFDSLHHLILPATILGLSQAPLLIRHTRSSMLETMRQDYVQTARAKGLHERVVVYRHVLRNAAIPLVTVLALDLPALLGGTVIIERIFAWPGMGSLAVSAVQSQDYPVIMAVNLIGAVLILSSNLLADILYGVIDPRIRYS